jgi:hypothetical protein
VIFAKSEILKLFMPSDGSGFLFPAGLIFGPLLLPAVPGLEELLPAVPAVPGLELKLLPEAVAIVLLAVPGRVLPTLLTPELGLKLLPPAVGLTVPGFFWRWPVSTLLVCLDPAPPNMRDVP